MSTAATQTRSQRRRKARKNPLAGFSASIEEQSALDQYLRDVSRHELITPDREKAGHLMDWKNSFFRTVRDECYILL